MSGTVNMSAPGMQTSSAPMPSARAGQRFPRTNKLLKHALFDRVYQRGQRHFSGLMTVFFLSREPSSEAPEEISRFEFQVSSEAGGPRIGLTVGRVLGNSVVRNRIRRRMREAIRLNLYLLPGPVDVVINPKKAVLAADFSRIVEEVKKAFVAVESGKGAPARPDGAQRPYTSKRRSGAKRQSPEGGVA